ncbi:MAG: hypothetical protein JXR41_16465, partial [Bacteroidales bacterium]|nr:hypothetical protein [Bacteroidales bacterium]MBN2764689.1 hypothetical protein [Bacteroidales bacterium]
FSFLPACAWAKPGQAGMRKVNKRIKKKNKLVGISLLTHITWHAFLPAETAAQAGFFDARSQLVCFVFQPLIRIRS